MPIESFLYSIPYLVLVIFLIGFVWLESHYKIKGRLHGANQQILGWMSLGSLLFFFGFRGLIGWDWTTYYPVFQSLSDIFHITTEDLFGKRHEPGFLAYMSIIKTIWDNYSFFIFTNTLIDLVILGISIRRFSEGFAMSCLIFLVMTGFYLETDLLRNAKSIMLFLLSVKFITQRRFFPFLALNLLGFVFHFSSLLFLPLYFFIHRLISRRVMIIVFAVGICLYIFQIEYIKPLIISVIELLGGRFEQVAMQYFLIEEYYSSYGFTIGFFERISTFIILIIYYEKLSKRNSLIVFINSYVIYFIFFFYFSEIFIVPVRVGGLFAFSYWILYPHLFNVISLRNNKWILTLIISFYSILKIISITDNVLYKYDNVIFGVEGFQSRFERFEDVKEILFR